MKAHQLIAGALTDLVQAYTHHLTVRAAPEPLDVFYREWAADRGLDLDGADVAGWGKSLECVVVPGRVER
jgi:hypothetical protein